jgi:hypothetical protein
VMRFRRRKPVPNLNCSSGDLIPPSLGNRTISSILAMTPSGNDGRILSSSSSGGCSPGLDEKRASSRSRLCFADARQERAATLSNRHNARSLPPNMTSLAMAADRKVTRGRMFGPVAIPPVKKAKE